MVGICDFPKEVLENIFFFCEEQNFIDAIYEYTDIEYLYIKYDDLDNISHEVVPLRVGIINEEYNDFPIDKLYRLDFLYIHNYIHYYNFGKLLSVCRIAKNITTLRLEGNCISAIPNCLPNLKHLFLTDTITDKLPEELVSLEHIHIQCNYNLIELPKSYIHLKTLKLNGTQINKIPETYSDLILIKLINTSITKIPKTINKLKKINIYADSFLVNIQRTIKFPENLPLLEKLSMSGVALLNFPKLPNLKKLKVSDITMNTLPHWDNLEYLRMDNIDIQYFPLTMKKMKEIFFYNINNVSIPDTWDELETITFSRCQNIKLYKKPNKLKNLKIIGDMIFPDIQKIDRLNNLSLIDCKTVDIPEEMVINLIYVL